MKGCYLKAKEKTSELINKINEGEFSGREIIIAGVAIFVVGILLGILFSPKKSTVFGSNNGNNNSGTFPNPDDEKVCECKCEDK